MRAVDSGHPEGAEGLSGLGVEVFLDTDGLAQLEGTQTVVKSPGVPREAPVIAAALERGIDVVGELELAWRALPNRFLAVTGTNGKTTTVELLGHIYRGAGEPVAVAGNVGTPLAGLVGEIDPEATVVCECSSFQLEDTSLLRARVRRLPQPRARPPRSPRRPRRLPGGEAADLRQPGQRRRRDLQRRRARAGRRRPRRLRPPDRLRPRRRRPTARSRSATGRSSTTASRCSRVAELGLLGEHNVANAMAAAAAALAMGIDRDAVRDGLRSFAGVPHRLEPVAEIDGVRFVNDSKATNVASAAVGIARLRGAASTRSSAAATRASRSRRWSSRCVERCAACYLIGETAERMARRAGAGRRRRGRRCIRCADLEDAVRRAAAAARARRGRPALARLRQLRRLRELRSARRALPRDRRGRWR